METWIYDFLEDERASVEVLDSYGAFEAARAAESVLNRLEEAARVNDQQTVSVAEAAALTGVHEETVRRAVRRGEIADLRDEPGQHIRVLRGELDVLRAKARSNVDKDEQEGYDDVSVTDITKLINV